MVFFDARLPVRFGGLETRAGDEAVLMESDLAASVAFGAGAGHGAGCVCCVPRTGAAAALAGLFRRRAMGGPLFRGVLVVAGVEGERAVREALMEDLVVSGRYRLAG